MLGKWLQLQTAELEETKHSCSTKEGMQQLLEQANTDSVRTGDLSPTVAVMLPLDTVDFKSV